MTAKERHRIKILEYLSNPSNIPCNRVTLARDVLKFKLPERIYRIFTPSELSEIEREAMDNRRTRYAVDLMEVDVGILARAKEGDPSAARLAYQRFEGWSEKQIQEIEHKGGVKINVEIISYAEATRKKIAEQGDV